MLYRPQSVSVSNEAPCRLVGIVSVFGGTSRLHHQGDGGRIQPFHTPTRFNSFSVSHTSFRGASSNKFYSDRLSNLGHDTQL